MTLEQMNKLHESLLNGSQMILDELEQHSRAGGLMTLGDLRCMSETMSNIADVRKDLAKAKHYESK